MNLFLDFTAWSQATRSKRLASASALERVAGGEFEVSRALVGTAGLIEARHRKTGLTVSYLDRKGTVKYVSSPQARGLGREAALKALLEIVESMVQ